MTKPRLYIDIDNVVFDTVHIIKTMYDEDFRLYDDYHEVTLDQLTSYNFQELNLLTKEKLNEYFCSGRFFDKIAYIDGAYYSIAYLSSFLSIPISFVSIGTPENIKGKQIWLKEFNDKFNLFIDLIGIDDDDKSQIDMSNGILIDDVVQNLESSNAYLKVCFGNYAWNKDWQGIRANNWSELRQIIYEEVKRYAESNN